MHEWSRQHNNNNNNNKDFISDSGIHTYTRSIGP